MFDERKTMWLVNRKTGERMECKPGARIPVQTPEIWEVVVDKARTTTELSTMIRNYRDFYKKYNSALLGIVLSYKEWKTLIDEYKVALTDFLGTEYTWNGIKISYRSDIQDGEEALLIPGSFVIPR